MITRFELPNNLGLYLIRITDNYPLMSVVERVRQMVSKDEQEEQSETSEPRSTRLYRCDPCDVTYVSEEMDACPRCKASVETTPTEHDLGLL